MRVSALTAALTGVRIGHAAQLLGRINGKVRVAHVQACI